MHLVVSHPAERERRWYGPNLFGTVTIGSAREADVQIVGHRIAARHVVLKLTRSRRVPVDVKSLFGVRIDGRLPRANDVLGVLTIGAWEIRLSEDAPRGMAEVDDEFRRTIADDPDARAVYADSLEERGRIAEAELMRGGCDAIVASKTPPEWRRTFLPIAIEACPRACGRPWSPGACATCNEDVPLLGNLAAAREHALSGRAVAVDPAVRRWPNDLRELVIRRPTIVMGQPRR